MFHSNDNERSVLINGSSDGSRLLIAFFSHLARHLKKKTTKKAKIRTGQVSAVFSVRPHPHVVPISPLIEEERLISCNLLFWGGGRTKLLVLEAHLLLQNHISPLTFLTSLLCLSFRLAALRSGKFSFLRVTSRQQIVFGEPREILHSAASDVDR